MSEQRDYSICIENDALQYITKEYGTVKRKIVTAANLHKESGVLLVGARHWSPAMLKQAEMMGIDGIYLEQGFIDQFDQFLSREDAKRIAIANGQPLIGEDWGVLFSENLH
jgi:hypothetical protein